MRVVVAAFALAPFVLVLVGMATGRARVQPCCRPTASGVHRDSAPAAAPAGRPTPRDEGSNIG